jgi:hypothetical protein
MKKLEIVSFTLDSIIAPQNFIMLAVELQALGHENKPFILFFYIRRFTYIQYLLGAALDEWRITKRSWPRKIQNRSGSLIIILCNLFSPT